MTHLFNDISITELIRRYSTPEYIVTSIGIICLAMLMCLCAMPIQQGWNESDLFLCYIITIIAVIGMAVCFLSKSYLQFELTDTLILILYVYFVIRYYTDATYPAESMTIHATLAIALYFSLRLLFNGTQINGNIIYSLLLAYCVYEAGYGIVQLIEGTSRHHLYPITGSFNNPGPYSACLVMGLVIILNEFCRNVPSARFSCAQTHPCHLCEQENSESWKIIEWMGVQILVITFASLIIITMSRTALIATVLCLFILFWNRMGRWKWLALCFCIVFGVGLYFIKSGSADGRMIINYVGFYAIADNPIFGNGVGSFFHRFAETTQMLSLSGTKIDLTAVDVIEYAFNDWLRITAELGVVGFILAFTIVSYTFMNLWRKSIPIFFTLLVILVFSAFSYPMELFPCRIISIIIISFAASQTTPISVLPNRRKAVIATITTTFIVAGLPMIYANSLKSFIKAEKDYQMMRGIHDPALIKDYAQLLPIFENNRNFLFDYGQMLAKVGRYNDSNSILNQGALISNDPMFLILQGNNYLDMGAFDKAEELYLKAWHTMPNRIYPLYKLMLLYQQTCNDTKTIEYANKVVAFKEKIPSPAVSDIKREAQEIKEKQNQQ